MIPSPGNGWVRLSPRKLLLDPVKAVGQAVVPVVVALVGISQSDMRFWPIIVPVAILGPLVLGAMRLLASRGPRLVVLELSLTPPRTTSPRWHHDVD